MFTEAELEKMIDWRNYNRDRTREFNAARNKDGEVHPLSRKLILQKYGTNYRGDKKNEIHHKACT